VKKYVLDTHTWLWLHGNPKHLSGKARRILSESSRHEFMISAISIAEAATLVAKGRVRIKQNYRELVEEATIKAGIQVVPVTTEIALEAAYLPGEFHYDPADRLIIATTRMESATVLTADEPILNYPHVNSEW
jgi:PIN domain nuclease of toxin-antitoxin system